LWSVLLLKFEEAGDLFATRLTPGGPKIQEHDFAAIRPKRDGLTVQIGNGKVRRRRFGRNVEVFRRCVAGSEIVHQEDRHYDRDEE
jgi:hypothetical protein